MQFNVNKDGSVTLSGSVNILYFTDYSSVKVLLDVKEKTYNFSETVKSPSGTIKVSDELTIKYSTEKITVSYSKTDNPYVGCKHIMTSNYTFEHVF